VDIDTSKATTTTQHERHAGLEGTCVDM
jgi:hypothetical protein